MTIRQLKTIKRKLGVNYDTDFIKSAKVLKFNNGADYSFKHIKVHLVIDITDTLNYKLLKLDSLLTNFCNQIIVDTNRHYRGVFIWEEKLKAFSNSPRYQATYDFFQSDYKKHQIVLSDSITEKLIYAHLKGEYLNTLKNNYYSNFSSSVKKIPEVSVFTEIEQFLLISLVPVLLVLLLIRSYKFET